jgi:hypothetical protein
MPEIKPIGAYTHFKCAFDVYPQGIDEPMTYLRKVIRKWCVDNKGCGDDADTILKPWFYIGNNPEKGRPYYLLGVNQVRTATVPSSTPSEPGCWGLELIHPDSEESARRWSAEIFFRRQEDGGIRFSTIVSHWMIPNFIGEYPELPVQTVPSYVRWLLNDDRLACSKGTTDVANKFIPVTNQNARAVYEQLIDPDRGLPFVFVGAVPDTDRLAVDPVLLYRYLLGNANVYAFFEPAALEEMNYYLGSQYRCEMGSIRCYQVNFDRTRLDNFKIHRFFSQAFIEAKGQDYVAALVANGFARNGASLRLGDLSSITDIFTLRRKHRIETFASQTAEQSAEIELYEEDYGTVVQKLEEWKARAKAFESENEQLDKRVGELEYRLQQTEELRQQFKDLAQVNEAFSNLKSMPKSLCEVMTKVGGLYPSRLVIIPEAFKAAKDYEAEVDYWKKMDGVATAWEMLYHLATTAYEMFFVTPPKSLEDEFEGTTGYPLAMSEGKQTKKDAKLMQKRVRHFEGTECDITPHVKYGSKKPKMLRVHFAVDNTKKRFVVGHVGDHIDNFTTKTM